MKKIDEKSWSTMWENPSITTFGWGDFAENYDGAILEFWKSQLNGEFNQVLDLACGNGALTWIANDLLNGGERKSAIVGVDFADIKPFKALNRKPEDYPAISFIGNNPIEKLPFDDNSVDIVLSQYGLEYSDVDQSIPEIARVLGPAGKMSFILHARDGDLVKGSNMMLKEYKNMLDMFRLDELILKLSRAHDKKQGGRVPLRSQEYQDLTAKIDVLRELYDSICTRWPNDTTISGYRDKLAHALGEATKKPAKRRLKLKEFIAGARDVLRMAIERKEDLIVASLTKDDLKHLIAQIKKAGFTITEKRILTLRGSQNWGTILVAERAPGGGLFGRLRRLSGQLGRS